MLVYLRNSQILLLILLLICPISMVNANCSSNICEDEVEKRVFYNKKKYHPTRLKKHKPPHTKKYRHNQVRKTYSNVESNVLLRKDQKCKKCPIIREPCEPFPENRVNCKIINPSDLIDSTCDGFADKLKACEAYTCEAPYVLDPSIKTKWQIHGKKGDRCIVSSTTENMGIKDEDGKPIPITQTCEYDEIGIKGLIQRFSDLHKRYFHFSTCERYEGVHNCTFKAGELPLNK